MNCRNIALSSMVMVKLPTNSQPQEAEVLNYDEELNEFEVRVIGAWRLHQSWWVPCSDILLDA